MTQYLARVAATVAALSTILGSASADPLITESTAARHGLARPWYTQIRLDPSRNRVTHLRLVPKTDKLPDTLFVQTDAAVIHAIDAQTGRTLWVRAVGNSQYPTMPLGANTELVAVANGTRLYFLRRADGKLLREDRIDGVPAAGTVMSRGHAFVPLLNGRVMAYVVVKETPPITDASAPPTVADEPAAAAGEPAVATPPLEAAPTAPETPNATEAANEKQNKSLKLKQEYVPPSTCVSYGRLSTQPILTRDDDLGEFLAWSTTRGLFVGRIDPTSIGDFALAYQLATTSEIVSQPTFLPPRDDVVADQGVIFTASENGEIFATLERHGTRVWSVAIGQPILEPVIPIDQRVYVATQLGGMCCLSAKDGQNQWWAGQVTQFVAASKNRIYAADALGRLVILDAQSGARLDAMDVSAIPLKYRNIWTDRIYLVTATGLVQCLRETEQIEPLRHRATEPPPPKPAAPDAPQAPKGPQAPGAAKPPAATPPPAGAPNPFAPEAKKPEEAKEPAEADKANPFG